MISRIIINEFLYQYKHLVLDIKGIQSNKKITVWYNKVDTVRFLQVRLPTVSILRDFQKKEEIPYIFVPDFIGEQYLVRFWQTGFETP